MRSDLASAIRDGFKHNDPKSVVENDPFLSMAALITSKNRASKNNLKDNFIRYKERLGWQIEYIEKDDEKAQFGKNDIITAHRINKTEFINNVVNARVLNPREYFRLKRLLEHEDYPLTRRERFEFAKTKLELFYRLEAERSLVALDAKGKLCTQVVRLELIRQHVEDLSVAKQIISTSESKVIKRTQLSVIPERRTAAALLNELFRTTPF